MVAGGFSEPDTTKERIDSAYLACAARVHVETKDPRYCNLAVCHVDVDREIWSGHRTAGFAPATTIRELVADLTSAH